jgi:hypothetical protein
MIDEMIFHDRATTDRKQQVSERDWSPHYSNPRYRGSVERTVFGSERPGIGYDYADRLWYGYGTDTAEAAFEIANQYEPERSAAWVELYISCLTTRPVTVHHIISQVGGNGYPYRAYGYTFDDKNEAAQDAP